MAPIKSRTSIHQKKKKPWQRIILPLVAIVIAAAALSFAAEASTLLSPGYRGLNYKTGSGGKIDRLTSEKPESKLWYNDGRWWGSLWSTTDSSYTIHWLDLTTNDWINTGTLLDSRYTTRADMLWDGDSQKLYVVSHVDENAPSTNSDEQGKLFRYSYNTTTRSYALDAGFSGGVNITPGRSETLVLEKDSLGRLWVTYVESGNVMINYSNASGGGDDDWATPIMLPVGDDADASSDDIASLITYNGYLGLMWSQQSGTDKMFFAIHDDTDAPNTNWQHIVVYSDSGDDHINLKSLQVDGSGRLFAVVKTSLSDPDDPRIVLLACTNSLCTSESDWDWFTVSDDTGKPTRPILLIDEENEEIFVVFAKTSGSDNINYKNAAISSDISFDVEDEGVSLIASDDYVINNPTSTKQNLNNATGLVVLASTHTLSTASGNNWYYFHNCLPLDGADKCYAPAYAPTVSASLTGAGNADVFLDWASSHDSAANLLYEVFESTTPYFSLDSLSPVVTGTTNATRSGKAGNPVSNHFYIVRAVNYNLTTPDTAVSNQVGEFDFAIQAGS